MFRSITFPMHTLSENAYRGMNRFVKHEKTKTQRADVRLFLRQLPAIKNSCDGAPNHFDALLVRISAGELDDDNLRGALKSIRDEVAAWIGLDDKDPRIAWRYGQQKTTQGTCGVRVEVRDEERAEDRIVHLGLATSAAVKAKSHGRGRPTKGATPAEKPTKKRKAKLLVAPSAPQTPVPFIKSGFLAPWEQVEGELVVTELPAFENIDPAPKSATVRAPDHSRLKLENVGKYHVEGIGITWLFVPAGHVFEPKTWGLERIEPS